MSEGTESAGSELAARVAQDLLGEAQARGFSVDEDVAQAERPKQMPQYQPASEQEAAAAPVAQTVDEPEGEFEIPTFEPVELDELEPDDDETITAVVEDDDPDEDPYEDEEKRELRRQLRRAQKEAEFAKEMRLKEAHTKWRGKMEKQYPLASWETVAGESRRAFERAAAQSHNANLAVLKPHIDQLNEAWAKVKQLGYAEGKQEAHEAWGRPTTGPSAGVANVAQAEKQLEEARRSGNLELILRTKRLLGI